MAAASCGDAIFRYHGVRSPRGKILVISGRSGPESSIKSAERRR